MTTYYNPTNETLVGGVVTAITLDAAYDNVNVQSVDGADEVWYLINPGATDPTVGGDGCYALPATISDASHATHRKTDDSTVVKLISDGTPTVSVEGYNN